MANFLVHIFDAWLQTICNAAVPDIPLHPYKRNWPFLKIDQFYVLRFLFCQVYVNISYIQSQLRDLCHQFSQCITAYKDFWDMMSEVDKNTWVLEPDKPTYSAVHRRIAISMYSNIY